MIDVELRGLRGFDVVRLSERGVTAGAAATRLAIPDI